MMRLRFFLSILTIIGTIFCNAQSSDSIEAKANYGSTISDVQILMELDKIDYYKLQLTKLPFDKGYFFIITKEYWNGKVSKIDTLLPIDDAKKYFILNKTDTSNTLTLMTKPINDSVLFNYRFSGLSITKKYKRTNSDEYSLRDGLSTNEEFKKIPINQTIPLFVYSLPYEDPKQPGYKFYCVLTANGVSPEKWWDNYKVKHYIVVEMKIVKD